MKLFEHQEVGVKFLTGKNPEGGNSFILADEMGTGKTLQAIVAAKQKGGGNLVVCPASAKIKWMRDILTQYPEEHVKILDTHGTFNEEYDKWFIINYDILGKMTDVIQYLKEKGLIENGILDEAHYIKGDSIRSKTIIGGRKKKKNAEVVSFSGIAKMLKLIWCLDGTPLLNRPIELFNILRAVGHPLGANKTKYVERYCGGFMMYRLYDSNKKRYYTIPSKTYFSAFQGKPGIRIMNMWQDSSGATHLDELREQLKGWMLRRKKEDVLKDLPPKIVSIKEIDIGKDWNKKYETAFSDYIKFRREHPIDGWNEENVLMAQQLVEVQKLKQVCSLAKIDQICEDIESAVEEGQKVIVFSQYTETIKTIAEKVKDLGVRTLTGEDKMEKRQESQDAFQMTDKVKVFVANIKAGGVAIDLFAGSIVMFADMEWSPGINHQAEDRAHRNGQLNTVNVYYYVASGTIEEDIVELLEKKRNIIDSILEGDKKRISKTPSVFGEFLKRTAGDK